MSEAEAVGIAPLREREAWQALERHQQAIGNDHLRDLFAADPARGERMTAEGAGLFLDYSKNRLTDETIGLLVDLANESGLPAHREAMFRGEHINVTEDRAVLHTALRAPRGTEVVVDGVNVVPAVHAVLDRMAAFADGVRDGTWTGHTGRPIKAVVNIGIGGSDLGPLMAHRALTPYVDPGLDVRFVSNVDPVQLLDTLAEVDPERTLFIVASKTFTTIETLTNARRARSWLVERFDGDESAVALHRRPQEETPLHQLQYAHQVPPVPANQFELGKLPKTRLTLPGR